MTEVLARISARRPWTVIAVWAVVVVVALGLVGQYLDSATTTEFSIGGRYESSRAAALLEEKMQRPERTAEVVAVSSPSLTVDDAAFRAKVEAVHADIISLGPEAIEAGVSGSPVFHYYQALDAAPFLTKEQLDQLLPVLASADGSTALLHYTLAGTFEDAVVNVEGIVHKVQAADAADDFAVMQFGGASVAYENNELATHDLERGERFGVPMALLVLLLLFGAVVATLLPLGLAIVSIVTALAAVAVIGQQFPLVFFVTLMVVMIGLAVGIDYSLLIVSRFKEEMEHGRAPREAAVKTGATAGRTVLFSGATVVVALVGLLIVPSSFYQSLALGAILVVLASLAATLTLLPAVLALLGRNVDRLKVPLLSRLSLKSPEHSEHGFWERITRVVTRRPVISILVIAVPMLFLSSFYWDMRTGLNDVTTFPESSRTRTAFEFMEEKFSFGEVSPAGLINPAEIVVSGDIDAPEVQAAIERLNQAMLASPIFPVPATLTVNQARDLALLSLPFPGDSSSRAATADMATLREEIIPAAFDGVDAEVYVGGLTAETADFYGIVDFYTPLVFLFVLGLSFIILMMVFRSIVIPIKAIIMNLLSVGTAYGLLVLVFQKGIGADLLGFDRAEVIDAWLPLFLFTILFGLSMDYHVFLLSRIRERYDETGDNNEAVAYGLRSTAELITGAALIMVVVFGAFATGETIVNQLMGFGLAVAVLLDATLVRSVLVPASMDVLGKRNWYLPSWLNWLPDLRVEAPEESPAPREA